MLLDQQTYHTQTSLLDAETCGVAAAGVVEEVEEAEAAAEEVVARSGGKKNGCTLGLRDRLSFLLCLSLISVLALA